MKYPKAKEWKGVEKELSDKKTIYPKYEIVSLRKQILENLSIFKTTALTPADKEIIDRLQDGVDHISDKLEQEAPNE